MKIRLLIVLIYPICSWGQINFQLGQTLTGGNNSSTYTIEDENYISTYYSDFRKLGTETFFKVSSYHPWDTSRFSVKYTLEFGLKYYNYYRSSNHQLTFNNLHDTYFGTGASNFYCRAVSWTNGLDFIYRINAKLTLINTFGIKLTVINKSHEDKLWGNGTNFLLHDLTNKAPLTNPVTSINFAPQLLIHFNKLSLGIHLSQDLIMVNHLINKIRSSQPDFGKIQLSNFTSFGISIMPNYYLISEPTPLDLDN